MLQVVTTHFNPCGFARPRQNYERFREQLGRDVLTVELAFDGRFFVKDAVQLAGSHVNLMWQKERLLNIALAHLPVDCDRVAWIDADLLFLNPAWFDEAERLLDDFPVVQLFEAVHDLDVCGHVVRSLPGWAAVQAGNTLRGRYGRPGGAWAARREILADGIYDAHVLGGGDTAMLSAWNGSFQCLPEGPAGGAWERSYRRWAERQFARVRGRIGHVRGDVLHLFHGTRANRRYAQRYAYLTDHNFDPATDLAIDENGLWRWASDKPEMHRQVAEYFAERREDDSEREQPYANASTRAYRTKQSRDREGASGAKRRTLPHCRGSDGHVRRWAVGVTTAPRRRPTLERTITSLAAAGWDRPRLFVEPCTDLPANAHRLPQSQRDEVLGAFPNWYLALTELVLRQPRADAYLLCQDDVLLSAGLRADLERHLWPGAEVGVVSLYRANDCGTAFQAVPVTDGLRTRPTSEAGGFRREDRGWDSWGALAYVFPNRSARRLLTDPAVLEHRDFGPGYGLRNIDGVVGAFCRREELAYYVAEPSLAEHIGETSTLWPGERAVGRRRASSGPSEPRP